MLELFNISTLDDNQIGHLMWVLNSPSYYDVFNPYLKNIRESANRLLLDRSTDRKNKYPDDFLAGIICATDGFLELFTQLINETNFERIRESQQPKTDEAEYHQKLATGRIKSSGVNLDEYDPAEDY
jgi:hypothetical protein